MSHSYRVSTSRRPSDSPCNVYDIPEHGSPGPEVDGTPDSRKRHNSGNHSSILSGLRNLVLRPRSESLNSQLMKKPLRPLMKVQVSACKLDSVYDLREGEGESSDLYDDQWAFRRPRSNSSDFLILRKTSRPLSVDVVGLVDAQSDPYRQYMKVVDCYELAPAAGNIIVLDKTIKIDKAFEAICLNNVGAGLIWDNDEGKIVSILTLTDFLKLVQSRDADSAKQPVSSILSENMLVSVPASSKILEACEQFCMNHVHRILVTEPSGDVLYLLTIKRILQAIHKQNRSLHFAQWLSCPIVNSSVGTWRRKIHTMPISSSLSSVIDELLSTRVSSIPLVDSDGRAVDVIMKTDIGKALFINPPHTHEALLLSPISSILGCRPAHTFLKPSEPLGKVLDALLSSHHLRSVFVVDDAGCPTACISQSDVIDHLTHEDALFCPTQSSAPSTPTTPVAARA